MEVTIPSFFQMYDFNRYSLFADGRYLQDTILEEFYILVINNYARRKMEINGSSVIVELEYKTGCIIEDGMIQCWYHTAIINIFIVRYVYL